MNSPRTSSFRRFTSLGEVAGLSNPADHRPTICVNRSVTLCPERWGIAEGLGFEVGMFASSIASLTGLAAPDHIVLTLSEFAGQVYRICRASNVPLLVDVDHGYGNALNVMRTVEELETAGVAALSIENTELPQPYGFEGSAGGRTCRPAGCSPRWPRAGSPGRSPRARSRWLRMARNRPIPARL